MLKRLRSGRGDILAMVEVGVRTGNENLGIESGRRCMSVLWRVLASGENSIPQPDPSLSSPVLS